MRKGRNVLSLFQQWLLIAIVSMIPVLVVVTYATWSFYQQMRVQNEVVNATDYANHLRAVISEQLKDLERNARQYRLLRDERFAESYQRSLESMRRVHYALEGVSPLDETALQVDAGTVARWEMPLDRARGMLAALVHSLRQNPLRDLEDEGFSELLADVSEFRVEFDQQISIYIQNLTEESEEELQSILWRLSLMGLIALPLTLLLIGLGFIQMIRPLRRLSSTIINLGHGDWESPIYIPGPRDFQVLGDRLEWMRGQLIETDRQKQAFLRHVSHELKTPLSAILEAASLLEDEVPGEINVHQKEVLRILVNNSQNLQELIQQLLNYNVITHSFRVQSTSVNLADLCEKISRRLDQKVSRHHVVWDFQGVPETITTDPQLLEMILSNLLSNAFHFSPSGATVKVRWRQEGQSISIAVEDQGPGIPIEEQNRIYEPFFQSSSLRRHGPAQGSGVGLTIVKESVHNLGGRIDLKSKPGEGCHFSLWLPIAE
ncbi:HAMP domain-containing sensor histidine kinase [Marinimicrobium sp. ABcell2]|uniref:sensor histidine kinase n=1 Tax=Marinimicrobium sp. ABcell2 TaxID=3069751 RepID=UPI0027AE8322|nr:HAMP domain-containing sensor histidine kinase [Marinimicrobium sp. ABcell2]MDQ2075939.1 HAMP domain-containing sensor histidine kinase [Marinimicrobium sp. ABcell2]